MIESAKPPGSSFPNADIAREAARKIYFFPLNHPFEQPILWDSLNGNTEGSFYEYAELYSRIGAHSAKPRVGNLLSALEKIINGHTSAPDSIKKGMTKDEREALKAAPELVGWMQQHARRHSQSSHAETNLKYSVPALFRQLGQALDMPLKVTEGLEKDGTFSSSRLR